jgi:hypothetical protein
MKKIYIINYNKINGFDYQSFHQSLTTTKGVLNWWHYIESSYIIITDYHITAKNVSDLVRSLMPNVGIFVCELNLNNYDGWLPKEAWEWINKNKTTLSL